MVVAFSQQSASLSAIKSGHTQCRNAAPSDFSDFIPISVLGALYPAQVPRRAPHPSQRNGLFHCPGLSAHEPCFQALRATPLTTEPGTPGGPAGPTSPCGEMSNISTDCTSCCLLPTTFPSPLRPWLTPVGPWDHLLLHTPLYIVTRPISREPQILFNSNLCTKRVGTLFSLHQECRNFC